MKTFTYLLVTNTIALTFFLGILPRIIVNSLNSDKTEIKENPFKYSHVLINN